MQLLKELINTSRNLSLTLDKLMLTCEKQIAYKFH